MVRPLAPPPPAARCGHDANHSPAAWNRPRPSLPCILSGPSRAQSIPPVGSSPAPPFRRDLRRCLPSRRPSSFYSSSNNKASMQAAGRGGHDNHGWDPSATATPGDGSMLSPSPLPNSTHRRLLHAQASGEALV
ncbi:hypothetical protein VPH35_060908 [Triticum aestivum]